MAIVLMRKMGRPCSSDAYGITDPIVAQASLRCEPEQNGIAWSKRPVAVLDGPDTLPRVFACNEEALNAGVEVGITKAQAGQCPGIVLRKRDLKLEESAQAALVDLALGFTPRVESTAQGVVMVDIQGTERIFGPPQELMCALAKHAAQIGLEVSLGAASNPDTALLAARGFGGITVVPKGNEADRLASLPVDILPLSTDHAEILDGWGIRKCRDLAQLPSVAIVERLGQAGLDLQRLARGETNRVLVSVDPPLRFEESLEFEDAVADLGSVMFARPISTRTTPTQQESCHPARHVQERIITFLISIAYSLGLKHDLVLLVFGTLACVGMVGTCFSSGNPYLGIGRRDQVRMGRSGGPGAALTHHRRPRVQRRGRNRTRATVSYAP